MHGIWSGVIQEQYILGAGVLEQVCFSFQSYHSSRQLAAPNPIPLHRYDAVEATSTAQSVVTRPTLVAPFEVAKPPKSAQGSKSSTRAKTRYPHNRTEAPQPKQSKATKSKTASNKSAQRVSKAGPKSNSTNDGSSAENVSLLADRPRRAGFSYRSHDTTVQQQEPSPSEQEGWKPDAESEDDTETESGTDA